MNGKCYTVVKLLPQEIEVVANEEYASKPNANCGYVYHVKFMSESGYEIVWRKEQAEELRKEILGNRELRKIIVDLADLWDGKESQVYGDRLQSILNSLQIRDVPEFYKKANMDKFYEDLQKDREIKTLKQKAEDYIKECTRMDGEIKTFKQTIHDLEFERDLKHSDYKGLF